MKMNKQQPDIKAILVTAEQDVNKAKRFSAVGFIVLVALIYGFVFMRINTLDNQEPSSDSVTSQVQAASVPHIDKSAIEQLKSLHDNSVNVQTLFNQTRSNPFSN